MEGDLRDENGEREWRIGSYVIGEGEGQRTRRVEVLRHSPPGFGESARAVAVTEVLELGWDGAKEADRRKVAHRALVKLR